jgi:cell division protein FtsQ
MKKISTSKIITLVLWIIGLSGLFTSLAFVNAKDKKIVSEVISIQILNSDENSFIDESDVVNYLSESNNLSVNKTKELISVYQIEKILNTHPAIETSEVSKDINGDVKIKINQRKPIVRIYNINGESYYIDTKAEIMPLSTNYTARVLVANGYIVEPFINRYELNINDINKHETLKEASCLDDIFALADCISKDTVLNNLIHQIYITKDREFELFPSIGNHKIIFGKAIDIEEKFEKLKIFYKEGLNKTNSWNKYSTLNIKYKNQVVCTKK